MCVCPHWWRAVILLSFSKPRRSLNTGVDPSPRCSLSCTFPSRDCCSKDPPGGHSRAVPSMGCSLESPFLWLVARVAAVKGMCMVLLSLPQPVPLCLRCVSIWQLPLPPRRWKGCRLMEELNCFWISLKTLTVILSVIVLGG